jgi:hypothetical protein
MRRATLPILTMAMMMASLTVAGCGTRLSDEERIARAKAEIEALDARFTDVRALPPAPRRVAYLAMKVDLEKAVADSADLPPMPRVYKAHEEGATLAMVGPMMVVYNYHAKALYWLANWRMLYADGAGVEPLLTELMGEKAMRSSGMLLFVQLRLRQGRIAEARAMAEAMVADTPEASPIMDLVAWYERIGQRAPHVEGRNLTGGPADPLTRPDPWLLLVFTTAADDETLFHLSLLRQALQALPADKRPRLVQITQEPSPLRAAQMAVAGEDLLWGNPNAKETALVWEKAWTFPRPLPRSVLVAPDRTVVAVELTPSQLSTLLAR